MGLKNLMSGNYTKEDLESAMLLIAEANSELRLAKLPSHYKFTLPALKAKFIREFEEQEKQKKEFMDSEKYMTFEDGDEVKKLRFFTDDEKKLNNFDRFFEKNEREKYKGNYSDYINPDEKKFFTYIYGPEGKEKPHFPDDLDSKSPDELEKLGFKGVDTAEFEMTSDGRILGHDMTEEKSKKLKEILEKLTKSEKKK